jgi:large subunit ribosomal protein L21
VYAVIATGGKQYRVSPGETVNVEKLPIEVGGKVEFRDVLMVADGEMVSVGQPKLLGATVMGEVITQDREAKIIVFKFRRRKGYRRKNGHRQPFTAVKITSITNA